MKPQQRPHPWRAQNLQMSDEEESNSSPRELRCAWPKFLFGGRSALSPTAGVILKQTEGNFQRPLAVLDLFAQLHKVGVTVITEPEPTVSSFLFLAVSFRVVPYRLRESFPFDPIAEVVNSEPHLQIYEPKPSVLNTFQPLGRLRLTRPRKLRISAFMGLYFRRVGEEEVAETEASFDS